ncbi:MAG: hypothetical protein PHW50_00735 [Patescibacteria group bacterium]|nr:hypothetical protein [Patescibacteria group bacterium]
MDQEYFYSVVVKTKTTGIDFFTYKSNDLLPNFSVVEVDFSHRKVLGMIVDRLKKPNFDPRRLKTIIKLVDCSFLFDEVSLELAQFAADFYLTSFGKVIFGALPIIARRLADREPLIFTKSGVSKKRKIQKEKGTRTKKITPLFLQADIWQRFKFYQSKIKKELKRGKQVLLLAPNLDTWLIKKLVQQFPSVVISPKGTITQKYLAWKKATYDKPQLIIGSQKALFAPMSKLSLILVEDEGSPNQKQEQGPKIEVSFLAKKLSDLRKVQLVLAGLTPLPSTYLEIKQKKIKFKKIFQSKAAKLVNLSDESRLLGFVTEMALKKTIQKNQKSIVFLNRLGLAKMILCPDCGFSGFLNKNQNNLALCPVCNSPKISGHSFGLDRLSYDLKKIFPKIKIKDLSKHSLSSGIGEITIATSFALKLETSFALSILGLAEIGLSLADPNVSYKIFHFSLEALSRGQKKIIQSFVPNHPFVLALKNLDFDQFYNYWLKLRKDLKLYPYYKTFKLKPEKTKDLEKFFKKLKKSKDLQSVYKLKSEDEEYLFFSLNYQTKIDPKFRSWLLGLRAKITVDPI